MTDKPLHWSTLRNMAASPAHCKHYMDTRTEPTPAMRFGSLVHFHVLGPGPYNRTVVYDGARRGKAWTEFKEQHPKAEIVTVAESDAAKVVADAVLADPIAGAWLKLGKAEWTIDWMIGDRRCAGTPDRHDDAVLIDLKVTDPNPARFAWHAKKMMWHAQLAWYRDGIARAGGGPGPMTYIVAVNPKPPHCPVVYELSEATLDLGRRIYSDCLNRFNACDESDQWPGYTQCIQTLDIAEDELELIIDGEEITI